ncbi:MAG TPA: hypothetical protein VJA21_07400 [Verrucomicrobiae bacterium]
MNQAELERKLYAAARADAPSERVPYAFEQRVMAHLRSQGMMDVWAVWGRALWRAAAPCLAITLLLSAWSWLAPGSAQNQDWSQALENTVLAAADQDATVETLW